MQAVALIVANVAGKAMWLMLLFKALSYSIYKIQLMQNSSVIIDNGSGSCKGGISGQEAPRMCFETMVGKPKMPSIMVGMDQKEAYIGDEAEQIKGVLNINRPINHGIITNWEDMSKIWHYSYYQELRIVPEDHPCLLTETPKNPKANREKMASIMFENFKVSSLYLGSQSVLSLYATGRTTGIVLDSGAGVTNVVPTYEGYALPHGIERNEFAGNEITQYFHRLLVDAGMKFSLSSQFSILNDIKEKHCYVAIDFEKEMKKYQETNQNNCQYVLPDGEKITLGDQRFRAAEIFFNPSSIEFAPKNNGPGRRAPSTKQMPALQEMVYCSSMKCDIDIRKELYSNIVLAGGSTMLGNMTERLSEELRPLVPSEKTVNITAPPDRKFSTWLGGSILSSLSTFQAMWITKKQYQQSGAGIIHRKCF